jgi:hypothetical protein
MSNMFFEGVITEENRLPVTTTISDASGSSQSVEVTAGGELNVVLEGVVSSGNSTTETLGNGGIFTGESEEVTNYGIIFVTVYSDKASATDGLCLEQSADGTNWDNVDTYTLPAVTGKTYSIQPAARYFRIVYTNGTAVQTEFRLQTIYKKTNALASSHRVQDDITNDDDAELVKAVLAADSGDGALIKNINAQHPLSTDGDSVYEKDLDQTRSTSAGFTGGIVRDLFDDDYSVITNSTATNPKVIKIVLKRPIQTNIIGITTDSGSFSNTKITATLGHGADAITTTIIDESADNTDKTLLIPEFAPLTLSEIQIEFHTTDTCTLGAVGVSKALQRIVRIQAKNDAGNIVDLAATDSNNLKVTDAESGLAIAKGDVTATTFVHKFGAAIDFDIADGYVTVWDGANDGGLNEMQYTYSSSAIIDSLSSSSTQDTQDIEVQGLDSSYAVVTQTITLTGQTRKALDTDLIRVFRMKNVGSSDLVGTLYCYENTAIVAGVPTDTSKVRAVITIGNNQTLMAIYTVPAGKTAYMRDWYFSTAGARKTSAHITRVEARPFGQVFQLKHTSSLIAAGTSYIHHKYIEPEIFTEKTDIEMKANTDEDIAGIAGGFDLVLVDN